MKRIISLLVILVLIGTSSGFAMELDGGSEIERQAADQMVKLSIFRGDGVSLKLDESLKREELMLLIARLQGKELQALTYNKRPGFADIEDPWWEPVIAWAYDTGITKGTSEETFGFGEPVEMFQMELFLLRVLGEDVSVSEAPQLAMERGLLKDVDSTELVSRGVGAVMMKNVLEAIPAGENATLGELLGLDLAVSEDADLSILSVMQTGERELTIELNRSGSEETLTMTRRNMDVVLESVDMAGNEIIVTTTLPLFETKYLIRIGEATASFTPGDVAKPERLEILTGSWTQVAYQTDQVWVEYRLLDQYGKEITEESVLSQISWQASPLASVEDNEDGRLVITNTSDREWVAGESFLILRGILQLEENILVATKQGVIEPVQGIDTIAIGEIENLLGEETAFLQDTIEDDEHYYALPVRVGAQAQPVLAAYVAGEDGILNTQDDGLLFSASTNGDAEAKWTVHPEDEDIAVIHVIPRGYPEEETLRVTIVDRFTGGYGYTEMQIGKVSTLETFVFFAPDEMVTEGDSVELPFEAYDQYGMRMLDYATLISEVVLDPGMPVLRFEEDEATQAVQLIYRPTEAGVKTLRATANGKTQSLEIRVYEESRPVRIGGLANGVRTWMTENAEITLERNDFLIYDQYNQLVDLSNGFTIQVAEVDGDEDAIAASTDVISGTGTITFIKDAGFGAKVYEARIGGEGYKPFSFTMNSVETADLDGFGMEPIGILYDYSRKIPLTDAYPRIVQDYQEELQVYGLYEDNEVELWVDAQDSGSDLREFSVLGPIQLVIAGEKAFVRATQLGEEDIPDSATVYATFNYGAYTEETEEDLMVSDVNSEPSTISIMKNEDAALKRGERFDSAAGELVINLNHFAEWDGQQVYRNGNDRIDAVYFQVSDQYGVLSQFDPTRYTILYDEVEDRAGIAIGSATGALSIDESRIHRGDRFRIRATADNDQSADLAIVLR
jgi:hypothetical protein